jgi:2-polyprenyl-6-methoxyphenol hydroxylase-like FAD-dependent oxidoreductase
MYDAIVVGARCAGSPTAMLLARKGYRVLLLDRATFPSDTPKGHFIQPSGVAYLERWGLLGRVVAAGTPAVRRTTFDLGPFALAGSPRWPTGQVAEAYAPRRSLLDQILVEAAVAAGAELRERYSVEGLVVEAGRVTGIRGRVNGRAATESARIVIGADGIYSRVARAVDAPAYQVRPALSGAYWGYWSGVSLEGIEFSPRDGRLAGAFPTNDDLVCVWAQWRHSEFHAVRADVERRFLEALDLAPSLAERVRSGTRETPFDGRFDLYNYLRRPFGPGWALVGDAGYMKDPITGQGIGDGFRDAELLTEALDAGCSGRRPLGEALADYERQRNEQAMPMYDFTCQLAALEPPAPEQRELYEALRRSQAETDRFLGTVAGTTPIPEFFSDENVARITGAAQVRPAA